MVCGEQEPMSDPILQRLVEKLAPVKGLTALVLGGSRARGTAQPSSDHDLGLYYEPATPLDVEAVRAAVMPLVDDPATTTLTGLGAWGPWINGGAWLSIDGRKVDLLYRDLEQVRAVIAQCRAGQVARSYQPGHPHGFCSAIWMGEAAMCLPLLDPSGAVADLKKRSSPYPAALGKTLVERFRWEAQFSIDNAQLAAARGEQTHVAGCAYRALACMAQVLFAANERYLVNEKGALAEAAGFAHTI